MTRTELLQDICMQGRSLFNRGLTGGASGNMSVRLTDNMFAFSPTGVSLGALTPEVLSIVDATGKVLEGGAPTKEMPLHMHFYALRPTCVAVVHVHSPYATAFSCLPCATPEDAVPAYTPYGLLRNGRVGYVAYHAPGSEALFEAVRQQTVRHSALLLGHHGIVASGKSLSAAVNNAEELEESCRTALLLAQSVASPLPQTEQEDLYKKYIHNNA